MLLVRLPVINKCKNITKQILPYLLQKNHIILQKNLIEMSSITWYTVARFHLWYTVTFFVTVYQYILKTIKRGGFSIKSEIKSEFFFFFIGLFWIIVSNLK
jgi:ABC-type transport system involved in Fe-S cluster assembly fused permease/ATPase subunit